MIRSESEYQTAVTRLKDESQRLKEQQKQLQGMDLSKEEIKRVLDPIRSFHEQLKEEVGSYERLKRGEFDEIRNFEGLGRLLVALRIAQGITQRELADRLGVHESQISRDERNEYHGLTVERASRILDALGADTRTAVLSLGSPPVTTGYSSSFQGKTFTGGPVRAQISIRFIPQARTRTSASFTPIPGIGIGSTDTTSGPPVWWMTAAFMVDWIMWNSFWRLTALTPGPSPNSGRGEKGFHWLPLCE